MSSAARDDYAGLRLVEGEVSFQVGRFLDSLLHLHNTTAMSSMPSQLHRLALVLLLALAAALRLAAPAWDGLLAAHPDERNIMMVTADLRGLDPYRTGEPGVWRSFAYGHLPVYLLAGTGALFAGAGDRFTQMLLVGRALSGLADTATVALVYLLARRLIGRRAALFAAAAYALAPLPVQLAHFYAVDTLLTLFVTAALACAAWYTAGGPRWALWAAAVFAGCAVGTKATGALAAVSVLAATRAAPFALPVSATSPALPEPDRRSGLQGQGRPPLPQLHGDFAYGGGPPPAPADGRPALPTRSGLGLQSGQAPSQVLPVREGGRPALPTQSGLGLQSGQAPSQVLPVREGGRPALPTRPGLRPGIREQLAVLAIMAITFALTNPFAFVHFDLFAGSVATESRMASGAADLPYTRQYAGTWPFAYQFEQLARWGMGLPLAGLGVAGLGYAAYRVARQRTGTPSGTPGVPRPALREEVVLLAWALPYALLTGAAYAKFARYLLPLAPVLCVFAAWLLARFARRSRALAGALGAAALLAAGTLSVALTAMYAQPHPWVSASQWIYAHVSPGASLGVELWDDALPAPLVLDGRPRDSGEYRFVTLDPFAPDTPEKLEALAGGLAGSDYLVLASQRLWGVIPRLAAQGDVRYTVTACTYRKLFAGELGFTLVHAEARFPHLGPLVFVDRAFAAAGLQEPEGLPPVDGTAVDLGRVDESYNVYDHPQVLIFANTGRWSAARILSGCPAAVTHAIIQR